MIELESAEIRRKLKTCLFMLWMGLISSACPSIFNPEDGGERPAQVEYQINVPATLQLKLGETKVVSGSVERIKGDPDPTRTGFRWDMEGGNLLMSVGPPSTGPSFTFQVATINPEDPLFVEKLFLARELWEAKPGLKTSNILVKPASKRSYEAFSIGKIATSIVISPEVALEDFAAVFPSDTPDIEIPYLDPGTSGDPSPRLEVNRERDMVIFNKGGAVLEITGISWSQPGFSLTGPSPTVKIQPGTYRIWTVGEPVGKPLWFTAHLRITSNDPRTPVVEVHVYIGL